MQTILVSSTTEFYIFRCTSFYSAMNSALHRIILFYPPQKYHVALNYVNVFEIFVCYFFGNKILLKIKIAQRNVRVNRKPENQY